MLNMEQSSEEVRQNMIRKRKIFFIMPVIRHYIAIFVTFFFFLVYHRTGSLLPFKTKVASISARYHMHFLDAYHTRIHAICIRSFWFYFIKMAIGTVITYDLCKFKV